MARHYIGIDLSSEKLDLYNPKTGTFDEIVNAKNDIRAAVGRLEPDDVLIFEATSGCDDRILSVVRDEQIPFVRVNPAHAWHFAKACNLPKTDRVDARMLSAFGAARAFEPQDARSETRERLAALVKRRRQLKDMQTQEKNRLRRTADPDLKRDIASILSIFERRVKKLDAAIAEHIEENEDLRQSNKILRSCPGVGPVAAATLIAELPELGTIDRRAIASLAGLAPRAYESGKFKGKRWLGPGRRHIRGALYMAALSVVAQKRHFSSFIAQLKAAGKAPKTVVIAVARKILVILNSMVRDQKPFSQEPV